MPRKRIMSVVGARPNFMKVAPILLQFSKYQDEFESVLVHTGQHYDEAMSEVFFRDLGIKKPDFNLSVGSGSHAFQTGEIMKRFEEVCMSHRPDLVLVAGDVNSTVACSLTATKLLIRVGHIESGLRSFDRTMPEEINRIVTDRISDLLFTTEASGNCNLQDEGVPEEKIFFVGNTMIDSLVRCSEVIARTGPGARVIGAGNGPFSLATIHRPSNVDDPDQLQKVLDILQSASRYSPVLFVTHPRTRERMRSLETQMECVEVEGDLQDLKEGVVYLLPPLSYLDFLYLMARATAVLTDSGGIQEETTFLGVPCLTLRENTERPITVQIGSNELVGLDKERILTALDRIFQGSWKNPKVPPLWDGKAAERIVEVLSTIKC